MCLGGSSILGFLWLRISSAMGVFLLSEGGESTDMGFVGIVMEPSSGFVFFCGASGLWAGLLSWSIDKVIGFGF